MWRVIFQIVPAVAWCVSLLSVVKPLRLGRIASLALAAILAVAFGKFAFFATVGKDGFTPDLPPCVIWTYGWVYAAAMIATALAFMALVADRLLGLCGLQLSAGAKRMRMAAFAAVAVGLSTWGIYSGVCVPSVRRVEVSCKGLPEQFDGYRIVHLSDLHCSTSARRDRFERIVERVNGLKPDLVAITGDFVDGTVADRRNDLAPLAGIRARDGVVGCTGNHEAYWEWGKWRREFAKWGIVFPEETGVHVIRRGEASMAVGGLDDPAFGRFGTLKTPMPFAKRAFAGAPADAFRILLFHRPLSTAIESDEAGVGLQLSGHTHGGAMPGLSLLVALGNEGRTRGLYEFGNGRKLHLSPGTGQWAGFPVRIFIPTEITELTLRR